MIKEKVISLGEMAAAELGCLERLGPGLWSGEFDALHPFGIGLAQGSVDLIATYERLLSLVQLQAPAKLNPQVLQGYISAANDIDPRLAMVMLERVLDHPLLRTFFIYLLSAIKIGPWGFNMLIELARGEEFEAWRFGQLAYGRMHESLTDSELAELFTILNQRHDGFYTTLSVLEMRFFAGRGGNYVPSEDLLSTGRDAIRALLGGKRGQTELNRIRGTKRIAQQCLSESAPEQEVEEIVRLLCEGLDDLRIRSSDFEVLMTTLFRNFPEIVLGEIFTGDDRERRLIDRVFKCRFGGASPSLNSMPVDRLITWCRGDQDRIVGVAAATCAYSTVEATDIPLEHPKRVVLSASIKGLLEAAVDKQCIVDVMFAGIQPMSWSSSLADIIEIRAKAFAELLEHPLAEVRNLVAERLERIELTVRRERQREAEDHSRREQRFE